MVRLKGSTLIETIVATLIVSVCFEIALVSVSRVFLSEKSAKLINAIYLAEEEINMTIQKKDFNTKREKKNNFLLSKQVKTYKGTNDLKIISIEVTEGDKIILNKQKIVFIYEK